MLADELIAHWQDLRGRTYDLIDLITPEDLPRRLPFPESATLYNQFWCMLGTTESFTGRMAAGSWQGWACSLDEPDLDQLRAHLQQSDGALFAALRQRDPLHRFDDGSTPLSQYLRLLEGVVAIVQLVLVLQGAAELQGGQQTAFGHPHRFLCRPFAVNGLQDARILAQRHFDQGV